MSDVVIVAADRAYPEYLKYQAYVGHPNRPYRAGAVDGVLHGQGDSA